jgi:hypothetical protein
MEELISQFPSRDTQLETKYRSFIYQPERISLNSRQTLQNPTLTSGVQFTEDYYNTFTCELRSPLLRVKSIELLRATIPNAVTSIPNTQTAFYYYRIPTTGAPDYLPDYSQLTPENIRMVRLLSSFVYSPDNYANPAALGFNKTFQDYQDLVNELNKSTQIDPNFMFDTWAPATAYPANTTINFNGMPYYTLNGSAGTAVFNTDAAWTAINQFFIPGDITFVYDQTLNKIRVQGNNYETPGGLPQYYYLSVGFADPNLYTFINNIRTKTAENGIVLGGGGLTEYSFPTNGYYNLNRRLGYLWNGKYDPNPAPNSTSYAILANHTFPRPDYIDGQIWVPLIYYTAEGYADLVNSANMFLFCDIIGGSTQDTLIDERLIAVLPIATSNLGVAFPENKISCPLTKISENIFQIKFTMRTDTGEPFWLPTNAYVNVELKIEY